jgi:uncharacterized membrane protein SpoIIM required for sporulation
MIGKIIAVIGFGIALYATRLIRETDKIRKPEAKNKIFFLTGSSLVLALLGFLIS